MAKGAHLLMRGGKPHKNSDTHASKPGMSFGSSNPDKAANRRIKVAKGLMVKH